MEEIKDEIDKEKIVITKAAGKTIESVQRIIGDDKKIIRTMPNTPALVGEGMTSISPNKNISEDELIFVKGLFDSLGKSEIVDEDLIHAVIGASGSSTAYAFMFIEAIADGAVLTGMKRADAYKFAAQGVLGAAKMVLETGKHPGELKDMVFSPGGTTIFGFTATTIKSANLATSLESLVTLTLYSFFILSKVLSLFADAITCSLSIIPELTIPPRIAPPIFPAPINPIFFISTLLISFINQLYHCLFVTETNLLFLI